jgi:hypothetical protein
VTNYDVLALQVMLEVRNPKKQSKQPRLRPPGSPSPPARRVRMLQLRHAAPRPLPQRKGKPMKDQDLADEIIARLNKLIEDKDVRADVGRLVDMRLTHEHSKATIRHLKVGRGLGFVSMINGLVGSIKGGPHDGFGYIKTETDDNNRLVRFSRTS